MKEDINIQTLLSNRTFKLKEQEVKLTHIELIHRKNIDEIHCEVIASGALTLVQKQSLKKVIMKSIDREVEVIVTFRYKL